MSSLDRILPFLKPIEDLLIEVSLDTSALPPGTYELAVRQRDAD